MCRREIATRPCAMRVMPWRSRMVRRPIADFLKTYRSRSSSAKRGHRASGLCACHLQISAGVLRWNRRQLGAEFDGGMDGPIGIAQKFSGQQHEIRIAVSNDVLRLLRLRNQPDRTRGHAGLSPDLRRKGDLVPRSKRNLRGETDTSRRTVDEI